MTKATDDGHSLRAICVDRNSRAVTRDVEVFHVDSPPRINSFNSYASPSPVIEEGRLYVCFGGAGVACLDTTSGKPIWRSDALRVEHMEGAGSSPILYRDYFILNCDGIDAQFVAALNKSTGAPAWRTSRTTPFPDTAIAPFRKAYYTPLIIHVGNKDQLISLRRTCFGINSCPCATNERNLWLRRVGSHRIPERTPVYGLSSCSIANNRVWGSV